MANEGPGGFPPPLPPLASAMPRTGPPWESGAAFPQSYLDTVREVLTDPNTFFANMRREGGLQAPLLFAIIGLVGISLVRALLGAILPFYSFGGMATLGATFVVLPIVLTLALFVGSGIYHVILSFLGGANRPFETTFRVVAYGWGSTYLVSIVPFCGWIIAAVWTLYVLVLGLSKAQETSTNNALIAVLAPTVICCGLLSIAAFIFGLGLAALVGGASSGAFQGWGM